MKNSFLTGFVLTLVCHAGAAAAQGWEFNNSSASPMAYVASNDGGISLAVGCDRAGLFLDLYFLDGLRGWSGNGDLAITIDNQNFPVFARDGGSDYARLFTNSDSSDGIALAVLNGLKSGNSLVLSGGAPAAMSNAAKTFTLRGSSAAIARAEGACR